MLLLLLLSLLFLLLFICLWCVGIRVGVFGDDSDVIGLGVVGLEIDVGDGVGVMWLFGEQMHSFVFLIIQGFSYMKIFKTVSVGSNTF
jgi:hypothetical protein